MEVMLRSREIRVCPGKFVANWYIVWDLPFNWRNFPLMMKAKDPLKLKLIEATDPPDVITLGTEPIIWLPGQAIIVISNFSTKHGF